MIKVVQKNESQPTPGFLITETYIKCFCSYYDLLDKLKYFVIFWRLLDYYFSLEQIYIYFAMFYFKVNNGYI